MHMQHVHVLHVHACQQRERRALLYVKHQQHGMVQASGMHDRQDMACT